MHLVASLSSYVGEGQCRATARVQRRLSGAKTAEVEATSFLFVTAATDSGPTINGRLLADSTIIHAGLRSLQLRVVHKRHS